MRHVGRFDDETGLPITEVTQAEFDALGVLTESAPVEPGDLRRQLVPTTDVYATVRRWMLYRRWVDADGELRNDYRRLVIVEHAEPARQSDPRRFRPRSEPSLSGESSTT